MWCSKCRVKKALTEFYKSFRKPGHWCKACYSEYNRRYYEAHLEQRREYERRYRKAHPEVVLAGHRKSNRKRRALLRGGTHVDYDELRIYARDKGICQICDEPIGTEPWQIDHFYPVSRGGPDIWQNVRAVHAECNHDKNDRMPTHEEAQAWLALMRSWSQLATQEAVP